MIDILDNFSEQDFKLVSDLVYRHCGINLQEGKKDLVRARLSKRLNALKIDSVSQYLEHVQSDASGSEFANLIDVISTNLTSFFREKHHYDYLSDDFLPALIARKRKAGQCRLRAWSAGCSTGEEPYTLAMLLLQATAADGNWDVKLLATDISRPVLEKARRGVFAKNRTSSVPPEFTRKYLVASGGADSVEASAELKRIIRFNYLNLMEPWPFSGMFDFIFCRNVMIYFDKPTQGNLINRFWDRLPGGGALFTGHSESLTGVAHKFSYVQPSIYRK